MLMPAEPKNALLEQEIAHQVSGEQRMMAPAGREDVLLVRPLLRTRLATARDMPGVW